MCCKCMEYDLCEAGTLLPNDSVRKEESEKNSCVRRKQIFSCPFLVATIRAI